MSLVIVHKPAADLRGTTLTVGQEIKNTLKSAHDRRFIYHTKNERIVMDIVIKPMTRGMYIKSSTGTIAGTAPGT